MTELKEPLFALQNTNTLLTVDNAYKDVLKLTAGPGDQDWWNQSGHKSAGLIVWAATHPPVWCVGPPTVTADLVR